MSTGGHKNARSRPPSLTTTLVVEALRKEAKLLTDKARAEQGKWLKRSLCQLIRGTICTSLCMVFFALAIFVELAIDVQSTQRLDVVENVVSGVAIILGAILIVWLSQRRQHVLTFERIARAETAVDHIQFNPIGYKEGKHAERLSQFKTSSASSNNDAALVYRDDVWQLYPTNLLLEGEIIAFGAGAPFPARVQLLDFIEGEEGLKDIYERGETFELASPKENNTDDNFVRTNNEIDDVPLLMQMGHLRRYKLLETPLLETLRVFLTAPALPDTPLDIEKKHLSCYFQRFYFVLVLGCCITSIVRITTVDPASGLSLVFWPAAGEVTSAMYSTKSIESMEHWVTTLFVRQVMIILLGMRPLLSVLELVLEASGMAQVLSKLRVVMHEIDWKKVSRSRRFRQNLKRSWQRCVKVAKKSPGKCCRCRIQRKRPFCYIATSDDDRLVREENTGGLGFAFGDDEDDSRNLEDNGSKINPKFAAFLKKLSTMDRDERQTLGRLRRKYGTVPAMTYIRGTLEHMRRLVFGDGDEYVPVENRHPLASMRFVERFGRVARLCCADESAAVAIEGCVEEIFLLKGEADDHGEKADESKVDSDNDNEILSGSTAGEMQHVAQRNVAQSAVAYDHGTVLDLCRDPTLPFKVRVEAPNWRQEHMLALKPIGLCALLCANTGIDESNSLNVKETKPELAALARAVSKHSSWDTHTALQALAYAIGFQDSDMEIYKRRCRIHLIAPSMEKEEEDRLIRPPRWITALPQMQTHMSSVVVEQLNTKLRSQSVRVDGNGQTKERQLHLMSCGHPVAVLGRCRQFWHGGTNSIWPLKKADRIAVLDMYERWSREGFDCSTCAYTPCAPGMEALLKPMIDLSSKYFGNGNSNASFVAPPGTFVMSARETTPPSMYMTMTSQEIKAAFSSAIHTLPANSTVEEQQQRQLLSQQIFLGMVASRPQPKEEMVAIIEDLDKAGVKFVFFSPHNPKRAKIMASQMGLETGWNSAVSLVTEWRTSGWTPDEWDARAKLPHGVDDIRQHLKNVDNVPLLVSLFTDSKPMAAKEMIEIFQESDGENDGIVCVFGSVLNASNAPLFQQADVAIGVDVISVPRGTRPGVNRNSGIQMNGEHIVLPGDTTLALAGELNSLTCAFNFKWTTNGYGMIDLIGLCRWSLENTRQSIYFFYGAHTLLGLTVFFTFCTALPLPFTISRILWFSWVIVPLFATSLLYAPVFAPMQRMVETGNESISKKRKKHIALYTFARVVPTSVAAVCVYGLALEHCLKSSKEPGTVAQILAINQARSVFELFLAWCFVWISLNFERRCDTVLHRFRHPINLPWVGVSVVILMFHAVKCILLFPADFPWPPAHVIVLMVCWPIAIIVFAEWTKTSDRFYYVQHDRRRRLIFDTKLGMWSPK